jgi:hypothetical protein
MREKTFREVGAQLGLSEEAAKKRVARAVEKLRAFFVGRGIKVSAALVAGVLADHTVRAAPGGLPAHIAAEALAHGASGKAALPELVRDVLDAWLWAKVRLAGSLTAGCVAALLVGGLLVKTYWTTESLTADAPQATVSAPEPAAFAAPAISESRRPQAAEHALRLTVAASDNFEPVANASLAVQVVTPDGKWEQRHDLATDENGIAEIPYLAGARRLDVGAHALYKRVTSDGSIWFLDQASSSGSFSITKTRPF